MKGSDRKATTGSALSSAVAQFESASAEVMAREPSRLERGTLWVLAGLVVTTVAFMSVSQLDRIVTAPGRLVPTGGTMTVQPLDTQVIRRILVSVGDVVHKGQVLATCDPTLSQADRDKLIDQVESLDAQVRRLTAEEAATAFQAQPNRHYDELQLRLYQQRRTQLTASLDDFDQRMRALQAQVKEYEDDTTALTARRRIGADLEDMQSSMATEGYVSKMQALGAKDQQLAIANQLSDAQNNLEAAHHQLASLRAQRQAFVDQWHSGNMSDLVTARNALNAARQDLIKAAQVRDWVDLVAPADGAVTRVPELTAGGVAGGAQPLFALVPLNGPLVAAVKIAPQDIGFVKVGDPVNIKLDAYEFLEHGLAHGVVAVVSRDAFSNEPTAAGLGSGIGNAASNGSTEYDARIRVTDLDLHNTRGGKPILVPGMTVSADIVVGRRTILWYLLGGALRTGAEALHEP